MTARPADKPGAASGVLCAAADTGPVFVPLVLFPQSAFVADDVSNIIKESVDAVLQNQQYNEAKVGRCRARSVPRKVHSSLPSRVRSTRAVLPMPAQVSQWTASCLENCVKKLAGLNKPFKYVVTCIIMQKNGESSSRAQTQP